MEFSIQKRNKFNVRCNDATIELADTFNLFLMKVNVGYSLCTIGMSSINYMIHE